MIVFQLMLFWTLRDNVHSDNVSQTELVSCQDIHNIRHKYNIEGVQYHANDHCSVYLWVENMISSDTDLQSPVQFYKEQGVEQTDDLNDFSKDDFAIGIQTSFQHDMLMKFGCEVINGQYPLTNVYNFFLITFLVVNDFVAVG